VSFNADRLGLCWVGLQFEAGQTSCLFLVLGNVKHFVPFVAFPIYLVNTDALCLHSIYPGVMVEVHLVSILCPSKNEVVFKINIERVIDY
jgi:hypothetical protein